jgi:hypothetical protein
MPEHDEHLSAAIATSSPRSSRAAWARVAPFLAYIGFIVLTDLLERFGWPAAQLRWLYAARIGVVAALLAWYWRDYTELRSWRAPPAAVAVSVLIGIIVLVLWVNLDAGWMQVGSAAGFDPRDGGQIDWPLAAVRVFGAAAVVPVMEELFWRSFLMRWIVAPDFAAVDPSQITLKSLVLGTVLFGIEHNLWLAGVVAGAAYSWVYVRYRTLPLSILAHAVTNFLLGIWVLHTASWNYW